MTKAETTDPTTIQSGRAEELQEPLLVDHQQQEESPPLSEEIFQRRGSTTSEDVVDPLEIAEQPEQDEWIGVRELRYLFILFQCVWPALLLAFDWCSSYGDFVLKVVIPSALLFMVAFGKESNIRDFRRRDVIPTAVWLMLPLTGESEIVLVTFLGVFGLVPALLVAIACFKHGPNETMKSGCDCFYYNIIIRPSNRFNCYKNLEDDFFEQLQDQEAAEQKQLEAQNEKLSYLEELAQRHPRRTPIWSILAITAMVILALASVFYSTFVLLSDLAVYETVEKVK